MTMFKNMRAGAVNRLEACTYEYKNWEKQISNTKSALQWSALAQRIGFEAALSAVTMGGARLIASGIQKAGSGLMASAALRGGAAGRTVDALAKVGRAAQTPLGGAVLSTTVAEAAANTLGRLGAVMLIQVPVRGLAGDLTWQGFGLALLGSLAGVPGSGATPTAAKFSQKLGVVLKSGSAISYQNLATSTVALAKGYRDVVGIGVKMDENLVNLATQLKANGSSLGKAVAIKADAAAIAAQQFASKNEIRIGKGAATAAKKIKYSDMVPFLARHTSDATSQLKYVSVQYADACARYQVWYNLLQYFNNLERAVLDIKKNSGG